MTCEYFKICLEYDPERAECQGNAIHCLKYDEYLSNHDKKRSEVKKQIKVRQLTSLDTKTDSGIGSDGYRKDFYAL